MKDGGSTVKMQLNLEKIQNQCTWFKKKLVKLIETINEIEKSASRDYNDLLERERELIDIKTKVAQVEAEAEAFGEEEITEKELSVREYYLTLKKKLNEMTKANVAASMDSY